MSLLIQTINELGPWSWFVLGLVLIGVEILVPGTIFLWFGIAALLVGGLALATDFGWQVYLILLVVLALASIFVSRRLMSKLDTEAGDPSLNERGSRYIGRTFILASPLQQGTGKLSIDDTVWRITGPNLPAGTKVMVVGLDGPKLIVAKAATEAT